MTLLRKIETTTTKKHRKLSEKTMGREKEA
jgi:hypothetical protein